MSTPRTTLLSNLRTSQRENYAGEGHVDPITAAIEQSGFTELTHLNRLRRMVCTLMRKLPCS